MTQFYKNSYPNGNLGVLGCREEGRQTPFVMRNDNLYLIANKMLNTAMMDAIWYVRGKLLILLRIYCHKPAAYTGLEKGIRKCTTQLKSNVLFVS